MKNLIVFATLVWGLSSCVDGVSGSGNIITEKRSLSGFTEISSSEAINVEVTQGSAFEVEVEVDDNLLRYLRTKVENGRLRIYISDNISIRNGSFRVRVTAPEITSLRASSASEIVAQGTLTSKSKIAFSASSSGNITAEVDAPDIKADASSSGEVKLSGKTRTVDLDASSSGEVKAMDLLSETADCRASSGGRVEIFASLNLKASASSGGNVNYRGNATVDAQSSSGGSIDKK